ncbi:Uncharacterized protein Adt_45192 [Abeliophyllum distichum]|uniref:Uncharacterized protein n=1 Tax=Abeliophyllum distichum TaxID=126358 RepID=A0ABD1PD44_9LAMI
METRLKASEESWKRVDKEINDLGAAYTTVASKVDSTEKRLRALSTKHDNYMLEMNDKYESIVAMLAKMSMSKDKQVEGIVSKDKQVKGLHVGSAEGSVLGGRFGGEIRTGKNGNDTRLNHKLLKIDFPQLCGENLREWMRKANKDFQLHQIPEEMRLADEEEEETGENVLVEEEDMGVMQISLDALMGTFVHKTIRILGEVKGRSISILIDSVGTHSFIDDKSVQALGYQTNNSRPLTMTVGNGQKLDSKSVSQPIIWQMQRIEFQFKISPAIYGLVGQLNTILEEEVTETPKELKSILAEFDDVFQEPKGLPPERLHDHHIPLKE